MRKKPNWINFTNGPEPSFSEIRLGNILYLLRIRFEHRVHIAGYEVDFIIKRPGKKGIIIEVDGDLYHMNMNKKEIRDNHLKRLGWEVIHIWSSEIINTPERVYNDIIKLLEISNPPSIYKEKKKRKPCKKILVSRSPKEPRKKEYKI